MSNKQHWESIYSNHPSSLSWHQKKPELSLQLINQSLESKNQAIIDVGGGASNLVDYLIAAQYQDISVLDISAQALNHSQQRLGDAANTIHWYDQNITSFKPSKRYDLWHDRAVFHFLTHQEDRQHYVDVLKQAIKPRGDIIIAAFAMGGAEKCSGLTIVQYDANSLQAELGSSFILLEQLSEDHLTPNNTSQPFQYFHFQKI